MPDVFEAMIVSDGDLTFDLRENLALELDLLGNRLGDDLRAVEGFGLIGAVGDAAAVANRHLESVKHSLDHSDAYPWRARGHRG